MKQWILLICLTISSSVCALPLSKEAKAEAQLFNDYLKAVYAQRAGDLARFELLQRALAQSSDSAYLKQQLVSEALGVDNTKLAQAYIDFIKDAPEDPDAWTVYGAYQWQTNHPQEALKSYEKALELDPDDEYALFQYIRTLSVMDPAQAEEELLKIAKSRPSIQLDMYVEIGRMYFFHQQYSKALEAFDKAVSLNPTNPEPRLGRASVYERTNQYFLMLHELEELEKMGYVTADMLSQMGSVFVTVKDFPRAKQYFERAKALDNSNAEANYFLALFAEEEGDYETALGFVKDAADYAQSTRKQVQASFYQRELGRWADSMATLEKTHAQFPDDPDVAYFYAITLYENKRYKQATRLLEPKLKKFPDRSDLRLQYALALEGRKKYKAMEAQVHIILEQDPLPLQAPHALNLLAFSLAQRGKRLDESLEYISRALELDPNNAAYIDTKAWILYKQGKWKEAADVISTISIDVLDNNPEIFDHVRKIYDANGDQLLEEMDEDPYGYGGY